MHDFMFALIGGALIGLAVSLMLFWNGRVTGISGIIYGAAIQRVPSDRAWRWFFITGLLFGGLILRFLYPQAFSEGLPTELWTVIVAGLLVGFGTSMGSGCTSGHGVCGISRLSIRSLVATGVFISAGVVAVLLFRWMGILP